MQWKIIQLEATCQEQHERKKERDMDATMLGTPSVDPSEKDLEIERLKIYDRPNWGGPLWRDRFSLGFLDPKLVSRKITFFDPLKEPKVWKTCES